MKSGRDIFEIIIFARAGQGAKSAAEVLAQAALSEGQYVQAFPSYGPSRSGAPTEAYVRISHKPIRIHEPIVDPDVVMVLDDTLIKSQNVIKNLDEEEDLIVNSSRSKEEIQSLVKDFKGNIKVIDANSLAQEILGQVKPNGIMLGQLVKVTEIVKLENLLKKFKEIFEHKIGKEMTEKNLQAIEKGYDYLGQI